MPLIDLTITDHLATITLNRPEKRNALSKALITECIAAAKTVANNADVRVVVVQGSGEHFCAGADLEWMRDSLHASAADNRRDAALISDLMTALYHIPQPVIARVQGASIGGGVGVVATADIVVAADDAKFGFSEVRLGIIPSVVAPYVIPKIGLAASRRYFVTGERITAQTAKTLGLVHETVPAAGLDAHVTHFVEAILSGGPNAVREAKQLVRAIGGEISADLIDRKITKLAEIRITPEAQEGMTAFLESRKPQW